MSQFSASVQYAMEISNLCANRCALSGAKRKQSRKN